MVIQFYSILNSSDAFIKKLKLAKGIETDVFQRKIVYDINAHEEDPDFSVLFR